MPDFLPAFTEAEFDLRKLADYCLDPGHPKGKDKARVFKAALSLTKSDAFWLRSEILAGLGEGRAVRQSEDQFGIRYAIDLAITRHAKSAIVRTIWIVGPGERSPRFVTCWIVS